MLSPRAIKAFVKRPRKDWSTWKHISDAELERRADNLPVFPPIWDPLKKHQKTCVVIGARKRRFAFFNDTGTGKTYLCLALMDYFDEVQVAEQNLVLVPNILNKWEWLDEGFKKHAPHLKAVVLTGSSKHKWQQIEDNPDANAFVETYAGFVRMLCQLKSVKKKGKPAKNKLVPDKKLVRRMVDLFKGVYCDESTFLKNRAKLPFRLVNQLSKTAETFFILTATPFGRNAEDLWSQMMLVDRGETLGETLGLFRGAFYDAKPNYWGGFEYKFKKDGKKLLSHFLDHGSITYPADEADLPKVSRIPRHVSLGETAEAYYERAKEQIMAAQGNYSEMKNAFMRMRQISSGFIGYRDDETGLKAKFSFDTNPKLELLETVMLEIDPKYKVIVFHEFQYSAKVISEMLGDIGIGHVNIYGDVKDPRGLRNQWRDNPKKQVLVLSNSSGGYGLNLQAAKYGIYYESPVGAILRKQTEKRFDRQYSLHKKIFMLDLIVRGTADQSILDFHAEGRSLWKAILNTGPQSVFD